jgi:hypothetical protein
MNIRNKLIVASAAALLLIAASVIETLSGPRRSSTHVAPTNSFATRFQPDPAVLAGIGSSRELTLVPLNGSGNAPAPAAEPPAMGGHHARVSQER